MIDLPPNSLSPFSVIVHQVVNLVYVANRFLPKPVEGTVGRKIY